MRERREEERAQRRQEREEMREERMEERMERREERARRERREERLQREEERTEERQQRMQEREARRKERIHEELLREEHRQEEREHERKEREEEKEAREHRREEKREDHFKKHLVKVCHRYERHHGHVWEEHHNDASWASDQINKHEEREAKEKARAKKLGNDALNSLTMGLKDAVHTWFKGQENRVKTLVEGKATEEAGSFLYALKGKYVRKTPGAEEDLEDHFNDVSDDLPEEDPDTISLSQGMGLISQAIDMAKKDKGKPIKDDVKNAANTIA